MALLRAFLPALCRQGNFLAFFSLPHNIKGERHNKIIVQNGCDLGRNGVFECTDIKRTVSQDFKKLISAVSFFSLIEFRKFVYFYILHETLQTFGSLL
jgi:hypothetical protein